MRARKRNDGEEEQSRGCFKAKLRKRNGALENIFIQRFYSQSFQRIIEASPVLSKRIEDLDKMVMATESTERKWFTSGQDKKVKVQLDEMEDIDNVRKKFDPNTAEM